MSYKIPYKRKPIVGHRQMQRRASSIRQGILQEIQRDSALRNVQHTSSSANNESTEVTCNSDNQCMSSNSSLSIFSNSPLVNHESPRQTGDLCSDTPSRHNTILDLVTDTVINQPLSQFPEECDGHQCSSSLSPPAIKDLPFQLRQWGVDHRISQKATDSLLKILVPICPELPSSSRTLFQTPLQIETKSLNSGEIVYLGVQTQLENLLEHCALSFVDDNNKIVMSFNVDGLPLFKSTNSQLWPILGLIKNNCNAKPFVIGLYYGNSKPSPLDMYLKDFVDELSQLLEEGFFFKSKHYTIEVHSFVCDAPARAMIKCTKSHGGYSACDKCFEAGEYVQGRIIYRSVTATRRTDLQFQEQTDEDHHTGESPLLKLRVGLVSVFPIDYMHAVCLGVMRKLLNLWVSGDLKVRLQSRLVNNISERLVSSKNYMPIEFNRRPRSLNDLARWKATEFRMFLLYLGPVVLKDILCNSLYKNFVLLHCGIRILCSEKNTTMLGYDFVREILVMFIKHSEKVYGSTFLIYNVHVLCHLSDDAKLHGVLDNFSAFPFENYLKTLKYLVRSPNRPLQQIYRRLKEIESSTKNRNIDRKATLLSYENNSGPVPTDSHLYNAYMKVKCKDFVIYVLSRRVADCYCYSKNNKVVQVHNVLERIHDKKVYLYGKEFMTYSSYYDYPFDSSILNVFVVDNISRDFKIFPLCDIKSKCALICDSSDKNVCFPLLHSEP